MIKGVYGYNDVFLLVAVYDFKLNNKLIFFRAYNSTFSCFSPPSIELLFLGKNQKPQTHLVVGDAAAGEDPRPVFGSCDMKLRSLVFAESEKLRLDHIYYLILGLNFNSLYCLTLSLTPSTFFFSLAHSTPFLSQSPLNHHHCDSRGDSASTTDVPSTSFNKVFGICLRCISVYAFRLHNFLFCFYVFFLFHERT